MNLLQFFAEGFLLLIKLNYLNDKLKSYLEDILSEKIKTISSVSGGDISSAFKIETSSEKFFLKMNANDFALDLFTKEAAGLNEIASTKTIAVPKIISVDKLVNTSFLIMEFIPSKSATPQNMQEFGFQLAQLHKTTSKAFV